MIVKRKKKRNLPLHVNILDGRATPLSNLPVHLPRRETAPRAGATARARTRPTEDDVRDLAAREVRQNQSAVLDKELAQAVIRDSWPGAAADIGNDRGENGTPPAR
jgi:hypothetical protein